MFSDLEEADNSHWVLPPTSQSDTRDGTGAGSGSVSTSGSFDPAVSRPNSRFTATLSPDLVRASPVTISHMSPANLNPEDIHHCKVCDVPLSGPEPARQHYAGKQHRKMVQKTQIQTGASSQGVVEPMPLYCEVCQKPFTSEISAKQHYESSKHLKAKEGAAKWAKTQMDRGMSSTSSEGSLASGSSGGKVPPRVPAGRMAGLASGSALPSSSDSENQGIAFSAPYTLFSEGSAGLNQGKGQLLGDFRRVLDLGKTSVGPVADRVLMAADSTGVHAVGSSPSAGAMPKFPPGFLPGNPTGSPLLQGPSIGTLLSEDGDILRRKVVAICTNQLEGIINLMIPYIANQVADSVLQELGCSKSATNNHPRTSSSSLSNGFSLGGHGDPIPEGSDQGSPGVDEIQRNRCKTPILQCHPSSQPSSNGSQTKGHQEPDEALLGRPPHGSAGDRERVDAVSLGSDEQSFSSMPPLVGEDISVVSTHGPLVSGWIGTAGQNDLSKTSGRGDVYNELWNNLAQAQKKKDGSV